MGVEYEHYVIPVEPLRRPSAERILRLLGAMESEGWLLSPKSQKFRTMTSGENFARGAAHHSAKKTGASYDDEACEQWSDGTALPYPLDAAWLRARKRAIEITWPLEQVFELGLRFPLTRPPYTREWIYFSYKLQWSRYLLELIAENVDGATPRCVCGESLALRPEGGIENAVGPFQSAFRTKCSRCGAAFDPKVSLTRVEDVETGTTRRIAGGGLYRFALVVDCGKSVPESGAPIALHPELLALMENVIGCRFYQIGVLC